MHRHIAAAAILVVMLLAACNPQPLPVPPTPIPVLVPATLPMEVAVAAALDASGETPAAPFQRGTAEVASPAGSPDVALGKQEFEAKCSICHNLTAESKVGPGLAGTFAKSALPNGKAPDDTGLGEWILEGGGSMPGVPLGDEELAALIAYLKEATE